MNQEKVSGSLDFSADKEIVDEYLKTKRLGFEMATAHIIKKVIEQAPEGETFVVPEGRQMFYKNMARIMDRNDLKFVGEK